MKKIQEKIAWLQKIAECRMRQEDETDRLIGKQVSRNLKMVEAVIEDRIVCCEKCIMYESLEQLIEEGFISSTIADREEAIGNDGMCIMEEQRKFVRKCDFCSWGVRDSEYERG